METQEPSTQAFELEVLDLGLKSYAEVWELQKKFQQELIAGSTKERVIICEHPAAITLGRSASEKNILVSRPELEAQGIAVFAIERGGDVTFHGPGQLVLYPILNLNARKRDVDWYMRALEEITIKTIKKFGITGFRVPGKTGVWTNKISEVDSESCAPEKIASQGVRISRWCTMHGASLNVEDCSKGFALIHPCGYSDIKVTSMVEVLGHPVDKNEVKRAMLENFNQSLHPDVWR